MKAPTRKIRAPRKGATNRELAAFFDRYDIVEQLDAGLIEPDPDQAAIRRMLLAYQKEPNTKQLNIRVPATAKRTIERLARRKTVQVSTLVRMWVIEGMRREASQL